MTRHIPEEVLLLIFKELSSTTLLNCQRVCRSWYTPAHLTILKNVRLIDSLAITHFIASIDHNPNQSYLKAVKEIEFGCGWREATFEKADCEKLFFRFPNLSTLKIGSPYVLEYFDQELCETLLVRCPKLNAFYVDMKNCDHPRIHDYLDSLQPVLSNIDFMDNSHLRNAIKEPVQFITQFPRLNDIAIETERIVDILPLFEQLSHVNTFSLAVMDDRSGEFDDTEEDDDSAEENAEEKYLSSKPNEIRDQIIHRLSNIKDLYLRLYYNPNNVIKSVSKYCTGLSSFTLERVFFGEYDDGDNVFYQSTFNFIKSINCDCTVRLGFVHFRDFMDDYPFLLKDVFEKGSKSLHLTLKTRGKGNPFATTVHFKSNTASLYQFVEIAVRADYGFNNFFGQEPLMSKVDEFVFQLNYAKKQYLSTTSYIKLLSTMPSLKKLELDTPEWYKEAEVEVTETVVILDQLQEATFNATMDGDIQLLLHNCSCMFINLNTMKFNDFSGLWKAHLGEFQLDLPGYSLEKLQVDVKPVKLKSDKFLEKSMGFFVLEVELLDSSTRQSYKVSLDLSSVTTLDNGDLKNFKRGRDFLRVHVNVNKLQQICLCMPGDKNVKGRIMVRLNI